MLLRGELEGNQSAADVERWMPARSGLVGIIPSHLSLGQADNPFRFADTLSRDPLARFYSRESSQYADKGLTSLRKRERERILGQIKGMAEGSFTSS